MSKSSSFERIINANSKTDRCSDRLWRVHKDGSVTKVIDRFEPADSNFPSKNRAAHDNMRPSIANFLIFTVASYSSKVAFAKPAVPPLPTCAGTAQPCGTLARPISCCEGLVCVPPPPPLERGLGECQEP
ncbi:hypothetical protein SCHPADRAFT_940696 [Schizopora paradoxa]|uniref:Uncharacterized protein n=1 Tax=Schizopora paradoxa TaxID=27342 RepID=A0A0H2S8C8_9AGAM|nr:hypothetical protein SCHPADRAFT_940696 [Schizopora paradoxa]